MGLCPLAPHHFSELGGCFRSDEFLCGCLGMLLTQTVLLLRQNIYKHMAGTNQEMGLGRHHLMPEAAEGRELVIEEEDIEAEGELSYLGIGGADLESEETFRRRCLEDDEEEDIEEIQHLEGRSRYLNQYLDKPCCTALCVACLAHLNM